MKRSHDLVIFFEEKSSLNELMQNKTRGDKSINLVIITKVHWHQNKNK